MKLFRCIINAGDHICEAFCTGKNKKDMLNVYGGNGVFEKIEDVTKDHLSVGSLDRLQEDLTACRWGEAEKKIIIALVDENINKRI